MQNCRLGYITAYGEIRVIEDSKVVNDIASALVGMGIAGELKKFAPCNISSDKCSVDKYLFVD
jgi:hypothetical protein